jgi:hypothetical protein
MVQEEKTVMKPWAKLLLAALALAVCIGGYIAVSKIRSGTGGDPEETGQTELTIGAFDADIEKIEYDYGGKTYRFLLSGQKWENIDDPDMPIDDEAIDAVATLLKNGAEVKRLVDESGEYAQSFGLDAPVLVIRAFGGERSIKYEIGDKNEALYGYYAKLDGADTVYIIETSLPEILMKDIYDFVVPEDFPAILTDNIRGIEIKTTASTLDIEYFKDGRDDVYTKNLKWFKKEDGSYLPVRTSLATVLAGNVVGIKYDKCVDYRADSAELEAYGLSAPEITIKIDYVVVDETDASTEEKSIEISVGTKTQDGESRYFSWSDTDMVFTVKESEIQEITKYFDEDLSPFEVCALTVDELKSFILTANGKTVEVEHREQTVEGNKTTDIYIIGGEIINNPKVDAVFSYLNGLKIDSVAQPGYVEGELFLTVIFKTDRQGFETMRLEAYTYSTNFYRISFNGRHDMLVSLRDVENLADAIADLSK